MARSIRGGQHPTATAMETAAERSPLLSPRLSEAEQGSDSTAGKPTVPSHRTQCTWPWIYVVLVLIWLAFIADVGEVLFTAPRIRFLESFACNRYYASDGTPLVDLGGSVPENLCKIEPVQSKVASVMGWQLFFDSIPAILLPIPYGYLADSYGRKWILVLALAGYSLSLMSIPFFVGILDLPLESAWLSSLFFLIGGGPTVATTLVTTIVADVAPANLRSTVFFYRFCSDQVADLVVPPIAAILMSKGIWHPLLVAVGLLSLTVILALGLPETLPHADCHASDQPGLDRRHISEPAAPRGKRPSRFWDAKESFAFVTRDGTVATLLCTFLISKIGRQATSVLFQYASTKYRWSLSQAGLLVSLRAGVNITLFTVVLPAVTNFALVSHRAAVKDLLIGKFSIALLALGSFIMFLSDTAAVMILGIIVTTLGAGFAPIIRSLVTCLVEAHHASQTSDIGRLYALISVMEGVGSLVAGPGMAWAFSMGISWGRAWLGLPFLFASMLFAMVSVLVICIKV